MRKLKIEKSFLKNITSIEKVLKLWRIHNVTSEEKITVFKALNVQHYSSSINHQCLNINCERIKQNIERISLEKQKIQK